MKTLLLALALLAGSDVGVAHAASFQCFVESSVECRIDPSKGKNTGSCEPYSLADLTNWIEIDLDKKTFAECAAGSCRNKANAVINQGFGSLNVSSADRGSWPTMISINLLQPHPFALTTTMGVTDGAVSDIIIMTGRCSETDDRG